MKLKDMESKELQQLILEKLLHTQAPFYDVSWKDYSILFHHVRITLNERKYISYDNTIEQSLIIMSNEKTEKYESSFDIPITIP